MSKKLLTTISGDILPKKITMITAFRYKDYPVTFYREQLEPNKSFHITDKFIGNIIVLKPMPAYVFFDGVSFSTTIGGAILGSGVANNKLNSYDDVVKAFVYTPTKKEYGYHVDEGTDKVDIHEIRTPCDVETKLHSEINIFIPQGAKGYFEDILTYKTILKYV